jgi:hypothetical protein
LSSKIRRFFVRKSFENPEGYFLPFDGKPFDQFDGTLHPIFCADLSARGLRTANRMDTRSPERLVSGEWHHQIRYPRTESGSRSTSAAVMNDGFTVRQQPIVRNSIRHQKICQRNWRMISIGQIKEKNTKGCACGRRTNRQVGGGRLGCKQAAAESWSGSRSHQTANVTPGQKYRDWLFPVV